MVCVPKGTEEATDASSVSDVLEQSNKTTKQQSVNFELRI